MKIDSAGLNRIIDEVIRESDIQKRLREINVSHSKEDGRFTTADRSGCDSEWFSKGERDRVGGSLTDKADTGRGKNKKKGTGKYRCHDNTPKWEVLLSEMAIEEGLNYQDLKQRCEEAGLLSFHGFLKLLDKVERASKGTLTKKSGK